MKKNKVKITEGRIYESFYAYVDVHSVLDYDYFINIFLPKFLNIKSYEEEKELNSFISRNKKLMSSIKSKCSKTLDTSAKQDAIQYIKEFGNKKNKKVIINIRRNSDNTNNKTQ